MIEHNEQYDTYVIEVLKKEKIISPLTKKKSC